MDEEFWHQRWELNEIGFHREDNHPELIAHFPKLAAAPGEAVFVPLCGKSRDLLFLAEQGLNVIGVELSPLAVDSFFSESGLAATQRRQGSLEVWQAGAITIFCGDFFSLRPEDLQGAALIYDRAALIALPEEMRRDYATRLCDLLPPGGRMLLITNSYNPAEMDGPPFSVTPAEVAELYGSAFIIRELAGYEAIDRHPGLQERGLTSFLTHSFLLTRR